MRIQYLRKKKCELEHNVTNQEECIKKKIKLLQMHLEEKKEYGTKLQKDISALKNKMEILNEQEEMLDMVC